MSFVATCMSVDPDGDVSVSQLMPHPDGALITQMSGTGKWAPYTGVKWIGGTDIQIDATSSTYSWKATD